MAKPSPKLNNGKRKAGDIKEVMTKLLFNPS
jgi:hypothetical protein